jgi:hypothetical protein
MAVELNTSAESSSSRARLDDQSSSLHDVPAMHVSSTRSGGLLVWHSTLALQSGWQSSNANENPDFPLALVEQGLRGLAQVYSLPRPASGPNCRPRRDLQSPTASVCLLCRLLSYSKSL